ncbi:MAG: hypothetical protein AB7N91_20005 [Candidatus Tectimicrobiota bacterium]
MWQEQYSRTVRWVLLVFFLGPLQTWATTPEAFEAVRYALEVVYEETTQSLQGVVSCTAVWRGTEPLREVYFFLPPNTLSQPDPREPAAFSDLRYPYGFDAASLHVTAVRDAAQQLLPFTLQDDAAVPVGRVPQRALLRVSLPRPYRTGETWHLTIAFVTHIPHAKNWGYYDGTVALDGLWYPLLVPWRQGGWVWGLQEFVHADYTLHLTTTPEQQAVTSVPWHSQTQQHGQQTFAGRSGPLYHLGLSLSARWQREEDASHVPPLRVVVPPGEAARRSSLLQVLQQTLAFYRKHWDLELPETGLTLVVHERDLSTPFSAVADNLLFVSRDVIRVPDLGHKFPAYVVARSLVRQWWGLATASNLRTERWIGEGLSTYLAVRWLEATYGRDRTFLAWKGAWLPNLSFWEQRVQLPYRLLVASRLDQPLTTPLEETFDHRGLRQLYDKKGALVFAMLHGLLGEQGFQHFLLRLRQPGKHLTSVDVRYAAEAVSGRDLHWFFQQWVHERAWLDYAVGGVESSAQADHQGAQRYTHRIAIHRLGDAVMPVAVQLVARDGQVYDSEIDGQAVTTVVTWNTTAPLRDIRLDPAQALPDIQRLNNTYHVPYSVRPLIDFPRLDRYLLYPFVTLDNNFIDGYTPRLHLIALYLDEQSAMVSVGRKEALQEVSIETQFTRNRFPHHSMLSSLTLSDRQGARTVALETNLLLPESRQQYMTLGNQISVGYHVSFLERLTEFNGEAVPAQFAPSTGRLHSVVLRYLRDTRIPTPVGAPLNILAEPLAYGSVLRLEAEFSSAALGSTADDFQLLRWEAGEYLRVWNQAWLQLRLFGGWSAGTLPLQRKLSLGGIDAVRGYPYRLALLGDHLLGGTVGLRLPVLPDIRAELPGRYLGLRSIHVGPFVDGAWVWDRGQDVTDVSPRTAAGIRLIAGLSFASLLRFEVVADLATPLDERGRREEAALQAWVRLQSTFGGGIY